MRSYLTHFLLLLFVISVISLYPQAGKDKYEEYLNTIKMRNIGPANMGGRTVDFAVDEKNSSIIYAAIGPSGLWKSIDNGIHWFSVFESGGSGSVGAVAISRSHSDIVWLGTGESTGRNSVGIGDGVYKSEDGGKTWKNMGLKDSRHIDRILIDPFNPDIVYVGAMGHLWGPNTERGVFKTTDGGKTWKKTLYIDDYTGIADMAMDPSNSRILYAATYYYVRLPYNFISGGPSSALYKSTDGGETWKRLSNGLPEGLNGRIGVAVSRSNPNVVYTLIENKNGGIFRSEDKGDSWKRMCDKKTYDQVNFRPFYYSKITIDPNNDLVIYAYSGKAYISEDGGKSFNEIGEGVHADHHRIWVDPANSNHIIDGNDGGIDISWDRGKSWYGVENGSWAEVYKVAFDMREPYYVYIGLQDNGNWVGTSNSRDKNGIMNHHWTPCGEGDGFYTQVDPRNHNILYRNYQMGHIERFLQDSGQYLDIMPRSSLSEEPFRFNWNSPILLSPHNPDILYFGGNFLFKSIDEGNSWEKISPDLSTNNPEMQKNSGGPISLENTGAEVHCTIYSISESPVKPGIIWTGTDDGNLWVTRDNGKNWENTIKNIKGLPNPAWVSCVETSHFNEGTVYVTFDRHNSDDYAPYVYKSTDFGKTWTKLSANLPSTGYLFVVRESRKNKNILFLGSEFGLFVSFDAGNKWYPFKNGFPTVAVRDIMIHSRDNALLVGTHGRGVYIMDDITPLENISSDIFMKDIFLFDIKPATIYFERKSTDLNGTPLFSMPNPPFGACISYYFTKKTLKESDKEQKPLFHIYDPANNFIRTLEGTTENGLNRIYWDLRDKPVFKKLPEIFKGDLLKWLGEPKGPFVLPGTYKIVMEYGNEKIEKMVEVRKDKDLIFPLDEWKENRQGVMTLNDMLRKGFGVVYGLQMVNMELAKLENVLKGMEKKPEGVMRKIEEIKTKMKVIGEEFNIPSDDSGFYRRPLKQSLHGGPLPEQIFMLEVALNNFPGKPTETMKTRINEIMQKALPLLGQAMTLMNTDIPELNKLLRENNFDYITLPSLKEE